jgi:hypothetical protein
MFVQIIISISCNKRIGTYREISCSGIGARLEVVEKLLIKFFGRRNECDIVGHLEILACNRWANLSAGELGCRFNR